MTGRTLVVVRHGRTAWNAQGRFQGHADVPLDEVGRDQAVDLAAVLAPARPARLWTSDLCRARETATAIATACGLTPVEDARLREYELGVTGLTDAEFAQRFPEEYAAWRSGAAGPLVPGEESAATVATRTSTALREHLAELADDQVGVIVMHGACFKAALGALLAWPGARPGLSGLANAAAAVLVEHRDGLRLAAYNVPAAGIPALLGPDFASRATAR